MRYADIVDVEHGVRESGSRQQLVIHGTGRSWTFVGRSSEDAALTLLARSLEERLVAFRDPANASIPAAPLARGDRDDETWTRELRDLTLGERHGYRQATVSREVLLRIAENPTTGDEQRIAALVALSPLRASDPTVRRRVAAMAPETTAPELREAIDAWLDEDEDVLERTLQATRAP
jgi:hypothetical protein